MEWIRVGLSSLASSPGISSEALALGKSVHFSQHHFKECPKGSTHIPLVLLFSLFLNGVSEAQKVEIT